MENRIKLGKYGEEQAAQFLRDRGYEIVDRNWRSASGEIDIVARDSARLIFVEVKTRNGSGYGHPFEAITEKKTSRMRRLAAEWCAANNLFSERVRLDAISVLLTGGRVHIEHLKSVF